MSLAVGFSQSVIFNIIVVVDFGFTGIGVAGDKEQFALLAYAYKVAVGCLASVAVIGPHGIDYDREYHDCQDADPSEKWCVHDSLVFELLSISFYKGTMLSIKRWPFFMELSNSSYLCQAQPVERD